MQSRPAHTQPARTTGGVFMGPSPRRAHRQAREKRRGSFLPIRRRSRLQSARQSPPGKTCTSPILHNAHRIQPGCGMHEVVAGCGYECTSVRTYMRTCTHAFNAHTCTTPHTHARAPISHTSSSFSNRFILTSASSLAHFLISCEGLRRAKVARGAGVWSFLF